MSERIKYEVLGASPYNMNGIKIAHSLLGGQSKVGDIEQDRTDGSYSDDFVSIPSKICKPALIVFDKYGNAMTIDIPKGITSISPEGEETFIPFDGIIPIFHPDREIDGFIEWAEVRHCVDSPEPPPEPPTPDPPIPEPEGGATNE